MRDGGVVRIKRILHILSIKWDQDCHQGKEVCLGEPWEKFIII